VVVTGPGVLPVVVPPVVVPPVVVPPAVVPLPPAFVVALAPLWLEPLPETGPALTIRPLLTAEPPPPAPPHAPSDKRVIADIVVFTSPRIIVLQSP
jgi:hypothetical protein